MMQPSAALLDKITDISLKVCAMMSSKRSLSSAICNYIRKLYNI